MGLPGFQIGNITNVFHLISLVSCTHLFIRNVLRTITMSCRAQLIRISIRNIVSTVTMACRVQLIRINT